MCHSKQLETEVYDYVSTDDLKVGGEVIWRCKGRPYTVQIQNIFGM